MPLVCGFKDFLPTVTSGWGYRMETYFCFNTWKLISIKSIVSSRVCGSTKHRKLLTADSLYKHTFSRAHTPFSNIMHIRSQGYAHINWEYGQTHVVQHSCLFLLRKPWIFNLESWNIQQLKIYKDVWARTKTWIRQINTCERKKQKTLFHKSMISDRMSKEKSHLVLWESVCELSSLKSRPIYF